MKRALPVLLAAFALPAAAQQSTAAAEHVTAPSAPGQSNKDIVVQPSGTLRQAGFGWVEQGEAASESRRLAARSTAVKAPDGGAPTVPPPPRASTPSGPTGPAIVSAAFVTVRGVVKSYSRNAITVVGKNGRERRFEIAPATLVAEGLKPGDEVVVRIPFEADSDGRTAERIERPSAPQPPPKSRFTQAQAPGA
jgi:hypothetical protein